MRPGWQHFQKRRRSEFIQLWNFSPGLLKQNKKGVITYFLAINRIRQDADGAEIGKQIGKHIEWTLEKIAEGHIVQAGKWGEAGGMSIIKAQSLEEAKLILAEDPLVDSGSVAFEIEQFYPDVTLE